MVDIIGSYKKMLMSLLPENLKQQLAKEKGNLGDGVQYILLTSVVAVIVNLVSLVIQFLLQGSQMLGAGGRGGAAMAGVSALGFGVGAVLIIIGIPILLLVFSLLGTAITWALAKVLGGKGSFTDQFYHFSIPTGGLGILSSLASLIPCVGFLIQLVLIVYSWYLAYLIYKEVHQLTTGKAVAVVAIPIVFALLLVVIVALVMATAMAGLLASLGMGLGS